MQLRRWQWKLKHRGSISLCMIMKNEEKLLRRCLNSVQGLVDEIIIVDTGSTDKSIEIAKEFGAVVLSDPWQDDFARPRNIGLDRATKDWILILDPDEVLARKDHFKIRELTWLRRAIAIQIETRNYTNHANNQGFVPCKGAYDEEKGWIGWAPSTKTRLFRNGFGLKFVGRWHELVDYSVDAKKYPGIKADVPVHHYEHEINQADVEEKKRFYLRMGEKKVADDLDNDQAWWELAVAEGIMGYNVRAIRSFRMSMRKGFAPAERLLAFVPVMMKCGDKKASEFLFEKAMCKLSPQLTHLDERLKKFEPLDPHFCKNNA